MPAETTPATAPRVRSVRAVVTRRRLLVGLVLALLLPGALVGAALAYAQPAPPPTTEAVRHVPLPQAPDALAVAQLVRSAEASRQARKLRTPQLLTPARTNSAGSLPTLVLAPRDTAYSLDELRRLVPAAFTTVAGAPDAVLLQANVDVPVGATLLIDARTPDVRLSSGHSAFATIISRGTTTVKGNADTAVRISTWDPQRAAADADASDGRSFALQIGGRMDVDHAQFSYLGFGTGTSSGVAWNGAGPDVTGSAPDADRIRAQGTVTNAVFDHNHFGAYTHEAQGMHWAGNTFVDNEEYGFDPHDFSDDFVVENNTAHDNGKHGFIFSRGCDGNVLRDNTSYANAGHGFMIDDGRSEATATAQTRINASNDNLVTGNTAHDNGGSGVEIEGGQGNTVSANHLTHNDVGVRVKDGAAAAVTGNTIDASVRYGVHVMDPAARASITDNRISGSWAALNLAATSSATLGVNPSTDVTTPLVVGGVATHDPSWVERVGQFVAWNPVLVLWGLILGLPILIGLARAPQAPFRVHRRRVRAA